MRKRTLRVRTVFNGKASDSIVRQLTPLLVLLFVFTAFSGCIGGLDVTWGENYEVANNQDNTGITVTNTLSSSTSNHLEDEDIILQS